MPNPIHSAEAPARPPTGTARDGAADRRGTLDPHREARLVGHARGPDLTRLCMELSTAEAPVPALEPPERAEATFTVSNPIRDAEGLGGYDHCA